MRKLILVGILAVGAVFGGPVGVTITVTPTLGPDFGLGTSSPNFDPWAVNVVNGMILGTAPGSGVQAYVPLANGASLTGGEFISTPFQSWQGVTPGPFATEYGTALYFSLKVVAGAGQYFRLDDLGAQETYLGQTQPTYGVGSFGGAGAHNSYTVGRLFNGGALTTGGESGSTLLSELYYVGLGFVQPLDLSAGGSNQNKIDVTRLGVQSLADRTTSVCYSVAAGNGTSGGTGCGNVSVQGVPEPGTLGLLGAGLAGLALLRRRSA